MGVIRNTNQLNRSALDEADWIYLSSDGEEAAAPNAPLNSVQLPRTRRNQRQPKKSVTMPEPVFKALGAKGKSHKKFRRYANANLAMTELGSLVDEAELEAVSINDFIQPSPSPFAMLLQKLDLNIHKLNEFINCTEEEQRDLIGEQDIELEHCSHPEQPPSKRPSEYEERDSHRCFSRIDPNIRQQLVRKHVPLGLLSSIEGQIVEFFKDNPSALYEAHFKCSFKRFLLHACCQYLNLNCQSVDSDGVRLSLVKNKAKHFAQPQKLLSEYLEVIL